MSGFAAIDLSRIAAPDVVETLEFESLLQAIKDDFVARAPQYADALDLESEPLVKLMESVAYSVMNLRQRVNDAARSVLLAYAGGGDLDNLAALFGVRRQLLDPGTPDTQPPVPPTPEDDERLRRRVQLSLEGHSTAGPVGSYVFWSLSADPAVKDVAVASPNPGAVRVTVLSRDGDGTAAKPLLDSVAATLNHEDVRPLTDCVTVQSAVIRPYSIDASLTLYDGPDGEVVRQAAEQAVRVYAREQHKLGHDITRSGLYAALHRPGVRNVTLASPPADIVCQPHQAAFCTAIRIVAGETDE